MPHVISANKESQTLEMKSQERRWQEKRAKGRSSAQLVMSVKLLYLHLLCQWLGLPCLPSSGLRYSPFLLTGRRRLASKTGKDAPKRLRGRRHQGKSHFHPLLLTFEFSLSLDTDCCTHSLAHNGNRGTRVREAKEDIIPAALDVREAARKRGRERERESEGRRREKGTQIALSENESVSTSTVCSCHTCEVSADESLSSLCAFALVMFEITTGTSRSLP